MAADLPDTWYEDFFQSLPPIGEDEGVTAVRLLGELIHCGALGRDGDELGDNAHYSIHLSPDDQWLVRKIEDAVNAATEAP